MEKVGAKLINEYFTFGEYDGIIIVEAPDDKAIMKVMLSTGSLGNVRTRTLKALTYNEENRKYLRIYSIFLNYVKITTKKTNTKGDYAT